MFLYDTIPQKAVKPAASSSKVQKKQKPSSGFLNFARPNVSQCKVESDTKHSYIHKSIKENAPQADLGNVKVRYNLSMPAQLKSLSFAQRTDTTKCVQFRRRRQFQGTASVPVIPINTKRVTKLLEQFTNRRSPSRAAAKQILDNGFTVEAGVHSGGIGGQGRGGDPRPHITIRSGRTSYHLHIHNSYGNLVITDITQ